MTCWSCQAAVEPGAPVCPACRRPQPPAPGEDAFATLGLPRAFALPPETLARAFRERTRLVHPDRFAHAEPRERRLALERATRLADARRELGDPWCRARCLLRLAGRDPAATGPMPIAFLEAQLGLRERLHAGRAAEGAQPRAGEGQAAAAPSAAEAVAAEARAALAAIAAELEVLLDGAAPPDRSALDRAAARVGEARFWRALLDEAAPGEGA